MTIESTRSFLQRALVARYADLRKRLARKLGSTALAGEALHETYLRLGHGPELDTIANPLSYLFRAALNTAHNMRQSEVRHNGTVEFDAALDIADEAPRQDRVLEASEQLAIVTAALAELPARQRTAFLESFIGATPTEELAKRYGVAARTIQADVRTAVIHCARRLGRKEILAKDRVRLSKR